MEVNAADVNDHTFQTKVLTLKVLEDKETVRETKMQVCLFIANTFMSLMHTSWSKFAR